MEYSNEAKDMALMTAFTALAVALHQGGQLDPALFLGHAAAARNRLMETGHTECVEAFDSIIQPLADRFR